ncbi:MAG: putative phage abortive infection protein [Alphaproteobacteria bacterium]
MSDNIYIATQKRKAQRNPIFLIIVISLGVIAFIATVSMAYIGSKNIDLFKDLGPWGDFFAGSLNPLLTFLTFIGVLITLILQRMELSLTRDEIERSADALEEQSQTLKSQVFESTFFEMLSLHNSIVNSIDLFNKETQQTTSGRDCFRVFYRRLTKFYRDNKEKGYPKHNIEDILRLSYSQFWKENQLDLGHYFRFLYNFMMMIDNSRYSQSYHMNLLISQLSDQELLILYYNIASNNMECFGKYVEKYAVFSNMPTVRLLDDQHARMLNSSVFGDNPMLTSKDMYLANSSREPFVES